MGMTYKALLLLPLFLLLGLAACQKENPMVSSAERYISSQAAGDWKGMCQEMSLRSQRAIRLSFRGKTCARALASAPRGVQDNLQSFAASVKGVEPDGQSSVRLETEDSSPKLQMIKEDGRWRVATV